MANIDQLAYTTLREALEDFEGIASNKRPASYRKIDEISPYEAYIGTSFISGDTSKAIWRIGKIVKSNLEWNVFYPTSDVTIGGNSQFAYKWDDRATLFPTLPPPTITGGTSSTYPVVNTYSSLPAANAVMVDDIYVVRTSTGVWPINRKYAGLYQSNGAVWIYLGLDPSHDHYGLVPSGGSALQVLKKNTNASYDYSWADDDGAGLHSRIANALTTGLLSGGVPTIIANDTVVNVDAGTVLIVKNISNPENATFEVVPFPALVNVEPDYLTTDIGTYFYINEFGAWEQYSTLVEATETLVPIFWVAHYDSTVIEYGLFEPYPILNLAKQFHDYLEDIGAFNKYGNVFYPNADLTVGRTAGMIVDGGAGCSQDSANPNRYLTSLEFLINFAPTYFDGAAWVYPPKTTDVDTLYWNNITTGLDLIPAGRWVNIYIYQYLDKSYDILYPQSHYASKEDAISAAYDITLINEDIEFNIKRCKITVQQGCTDLTDTACAIFTSINRFSSSSGSTGGGSGGEVNTASNLGTEGIGLFDSKVGVELRFKNIVSKSDGITVTNNATNHTIELSRKESFRHIELNVNSYQEKNNMTLDGNGNPWVRTWLTTNGDITLTCGYDVGQNLITKTLGGAGLPAGTATVCTYTYDGDKPPMKTYA
jgi:hypothetical protein